MLFQVKLPHIPQVLDGKSPHTGKLVLQIRSKLLHDRLSPSFSFLSFRNHLAYIPVKANQFLVYRLERGILSGTDALFYLDKKGCIISGEFFGCSIHPTGANPEKSST